MKKTEKEIFNRIKNLMSRLDMPYYKRREIRTERIGEWYQLYIEFCVPYISMKSLMKLCDEREISMSFDKGELELCFMKNSDKLKLLFKRIIEKKTSYN